MQSKSLLIALAAFAVTAAGTQAYIGNKQMSRAGLSSQQISAFCEARELRRTGERTRARDVLVSANMDEEALDRLRGEVTCTRDAVALALASDDLQAFREAVADTPLSDIVTTDADFAIFKEAYQLKLHGAPRAAAEHLSQLTDEVIADDAYTEASDLLPPAIAEAAAVAHQANDRETANAILAEAGFDARG